MRRATKKRLEVVSQDNAFVFRAMHGPELLIQTVEKYPCLWDTRNDNHFKKDEREIAWKKVCEEVFDDWHLKDENEKWNKNTDLRQKWTHIRDYYRKDLRRLQKLPPGTDKRKQKRYVFSELLHFLAPLYDASLKNNERTESLESDSSTQKESEYSENPYYEDDDKSFIMEPPMASIATTSRTTPPSTSNNSRTGTIDITGKRKACLLNESLVSLLHPENITPMEPPTENDDTQFLLSLRGDLKQLNHSQKLEFKIGVLQLIQKIMYSDQTKKPKLSATEFKNEAEHVMSTVLKMSPVSVNENSQQSFDNT